jgi:hypothetical protein
MPLKTAEPALKNTVDNPAGFVNLNIILYFSVGSG